MQTVDIRINLDPVNDGITMLPDQVVRKDRGAVIVGTDGTYKFIEEMDALKIMNDLSEVGGSAFMGSSEYILVYNKEKVMTTEQGDYLVGSGIILRGTSYGVDFIGDDEVEEAVALFAGKLATLCGGGIQFSAYEI